MPTHKIVGGERWIKMAHHPHLPLPLETDHIRTRWYA